VPHGAAVGDGCAELVGGILAGQPPSTSQVAFSSVERSTRRWPVYCMFPVRCGRRFWTFAVSLPAVGAPTVSCTSIMNVSSSAQEKSTHSVRLIDATRMAAELSRIVG
jgi:hypothetical protein